MQNNSNTYEDDLEVSHEIKLTIQDEDKDDETIISQLSSVSSSNHYTPFDIESCESNVSFPHLNHNEVEDLNVERCKQNEKDKLKVLQQKLVEESDNKLIEDLFHIGDPNNSQVLLTVHTDKIGLEFNTRDQYVSFAEECAIRVKYGTSLYLYEFHKTLFSNLSNKMSNEHIKLLIKYLESVVVKSSAVYNKPILKKEIEMRNKRHNEIFGEVDDADYDHYNSYTVRYDMV
jgi:hypothetical protein